MRKLFFTILITLLLSTSNGQGTSNVFAAPKGTWHFPISNVMAIDTIGTDCLGLPTNSYGLVLKTDCPEEVRVLQAGVILAISEYGEVYTVMVRTDDYFLVYVGLSKPKIKKGDIVQQNSMIGTLTKWSDEETYDLALMLLKGAKTININRWFDWKNAHNNVFSLTLTE